MAKRRAAKKTAKRKAKVYTQADVYKAMAGAMGRGLPKRRAAKKTTKRKKYTLPSVPHLATAPWMAAAGTGASSQGLYSAMAAAPKKRGRKKGTKNKPKHPYASAYQAMAGAMGPKAPAKRGRGRPKGSKAKAHPYAAAYQAMAGAMGPKAPARRRKPKREAIVHIRAVGTHRARDIEVLEPTSAQMAHAGVPGIAPSFRQNWRSKWASKGEMHRHHNGYEWVYGGVHAAPQTFPRMRPGPSEVVPRRRKKKAAKKRRATSVTRRTAAKRTTTTRRTAAKRHTGPKRGRPKGTTKTAMQAKEALAKKFLGKISCRACAGKGCIKCHIKMKR